MITDEHAKLDPALAAALMDNSPRLFITKPVLIRHPDSPTGWLVVIPTDDSLRLWLDDSVLRPPQ